MMLQPNVIEIRSQYEADDPFWPGQLVVVLEMKQRLLGFEWGLGSALEYFSNVPGSVYHATYMQEWASAIELARLVQGRGDHLIQLGSDIWDVKEDECHKCLSHLASALGYLAAGDEGRYRTYVIWAMVVMGKHKSFATFGFDLVIARFYSLEGKKGQA